MIVVTGATGNVGGALVRMLAADGGRVTATSRNISASDVPDGVRHVRADLTDADGLRPVLDGADALFLQNGGPSAHLIDPHALLDAAKAGGVRRVVLLSTLGVATRPDSVSHGVVAGAIEDAVRASGLDWTILRPGNLASNAYAWAESVRAHRTVAAPFGDVGLPAVDPSDIAVVGAAALRADGHAGRTYELTGPAPVTPRRQAEAIGDAIGEPVRFVELTREEARAHMRAFMPEPVIETTLSILGEPTERERRVSPDVEDVLGRAPRTFADWAREHAPAFR
ncbi:NAD-dependent epimerase/dehydratase family protein [Actinomadura logoneensis]|uniref:NAD-dependent epimerase/dehydratase family protein n=1 Tax=Actinomadura logoneensis TaxID=2293572 RepID=A0A372JP82_9ACTN|nr:NAD(P)H-binding protein [Actinomadura logoneensis]RFU41827.1 NAD-dependent epimerase/dehydratase family protein [Actinomadura logoneensis]